MRNPNGLIISGFHKYGYSVSVFMDRNNGMPDVYETCGNSLYESTFIITDLGKNSGRLPLNTLRKYAKQTSLEMAEEYGIDKKSVFVERDLDTEDEMTRVFQEMY
jgi:hypothetical protein